MPATEEAKADLYKKARPEIEPIADSVLEGVTDVYLGYPIFWGTMPMAVYTVSEGHNFKGVTIHPFCTHEGSGASNTRRDIENASKAKSVTSPLAIIGSNAKKSDAAIEGWLRFEGTL